MAPAERSSALEELTAAQISKIFPSVYVIRSSVIVLVRSCHISLTSVQSAQSTSSNPAPLRSIST